MNRTRLFVAIAALTCTAASLLAQQASFRAGTVTIAVYASVTDRSGRIVPGLTQQDFQILDDGKAVDITQFSNAPQPATVALMLDMSDSMVRKVMRVREATLRFIDAMQPGDRARIGSFGTEIALSPLLTGDRKQLTRILNEELWPGGATPLWGALKAGMDSLAGETGRRVVLGLTDGDDSGTLPGYAATAADVERTAVDDDFMLYAVGLEGAGLDRRLVRVVEQTGGAHVEVKRDADLPATFTRIVEELRQEYLIGFVPRALDGKSHRIDVKLQRSGLNVRARRSYLATVGR